MLSRGNVLIAALLCFLSLVWISTASAQQTTAVGSAVEVREGDTWSKAKVLRNDGAKLLIQYDDGTQELVELDRVRTNSNTTALPQPAVVDTPASAVRATAHVFSVQEAVEVKRGDKWFAAHVQQVTPNWLFVTEDEDEHQKRWAEPWAVRIVGSDYDIESGGTETWPAELGQVAPKRSEKSAPASVGDAFVVTPEDQRTTVSKEDLRQNFVPVSFDNSHEPATGGDPAVHIATTQPGSEFAAWALRGSENSIGGVLPCFNSNKIAVASFPGSFGKWSAVIRTNLLSHSQLDTRSLHIPDLIPIAAAQDGDLLLTTLEDKNVQLWQWTNRSYKLVENLRIDTGDFDRVMSAAFVAPDRVVVSAANGEVYLIDLTQKQVISSVKGSPDARLYVQPSGQLIGIVTSSASALLLRPDFSVIAEFPDAGSTSNVTVDPTGQWAAYLASTGVVRVVKISDGSEIGKIAVGSAFKGRLDLVDDQFLLVDHTTAYDVKSGIPVWIYKMPANVFVTPLWSGQFLIAAPGDRRAAIAVATIPDKSGRAALKTASPDRFMLMPGKAIKVDCDFNAFGDQKQKASDAVATVLTSAGMKISDADEPFHLTMTIAAGPSEKRDYAPSMFAGPFRKITTVDVPSNTLTATLAFKGEAIWSQQIEFKAGSVLQKFGDQTYQDSANNAAKPNAEALKSLNFPSYLPVGAKPGTPAALGASVMQDRRFVPERPVPAK